MASSSSPPIPLSTKPVMSARLPTPSPNSKPTPLATMIALETGAHSSSSSLETTAYGVFENTSTGLEALRGVLEATSTFPFVKYIASVGIQIIQIVLDAQINNDAFRSLSMRAKDIVLAVARSCEGMQDMAAQLEKDLMQLTGTMNDILSFASDKISRKRYKKLWNRSEDAAAVKALDTQLNHAFQIFEIQSNVNSRLLQHQMVRQISNLSISPPPASAPATPALTPLPVAPSFIPDVPLRITEGIYLIQSAVDGQVLQIDGCKQPGGTHIHLAPSQGGRLLRQLWYIKGKAREATYFIQSIAFGSVMDIWCDAHTSGAHVAAHESHGGGNQNWAIYGSRTGSQSSGDFCSIRSTGKQTILDAKCPISRKNCDSLHVTSMPPQGPRTSQEWSLIRFTFTPSPRPSLQLHSRQSSGYSPGPARRTYRLQSVSSGLYARHMPDRSGANVVLQKDLTSSSEWGFIYTMHNRHPPQPDMFALATISPDFVGTMDHYGGSHINVSKFWPDNIFHGWIAIPRDGAFIFKNHASNRYLFAGSGSVVETAPHRAFDNSACLWRLVDVVSGEPSKVLYDSALSILPPEISGPPLLPPPPLSPSQPGTTLQVGHATEPMHRNFVDSLQAEHDMLRHLFATGYSTVVVAPRVFVGWRQGRVTTMKFEDNEADLDEERPRPGRSFDECTP